MKVVRFVPLALCAVCAAVLAGLLVSGAHPSWMGGWLRAAVAPAAVLGVVAAALAALHPAWHERGAHPLVWESCAMFVSAVFVAGGLVMTGGALGAWGPLAQGDAASGQASAALGDTEPAPGGGSQPEPGADADDNALPASFEPLALDEFASYANPQLAPKGTAAVYVGRRGCPACQRFAEEAGARLSAEGLRMPAYRTDQSLDAQDAQRQRELLQRLGIDVVPVVVVAQDGEVVQVVHGPLEKLDDLILVLQGKQAAIAEEPSSASGPQGQCDDGSPDCNPA